MPLDLDPIRKRLARIDPDFWWDACAPDDDDTVPSDSEFARHAPQDIAALIAEVESLRAENKALRAELEQTKHDIDAELRHLGDGFLEQWSEG